MERDELITILKQSAESSLNSAGKKPASVLGVALGWAFELDPNDEAGNEGVRVTWWTYFDKEPGEAETEFAGTSSDIVCEELWRHLIWVDHKSVVTKSLPEDHPFPSGCWLYRRNNM